MKKLIALMLAVLMLCALAACNNNSNPTTPTGTPPAEGFAFTYQGVKLVPGVEFDDASLPVAESFENPNCAGEGKFITYQHDAMELTVNVNGGKTVIYSIYLTDANTPTAEGLYLGDDAARVTEVYGDGAITEDGSLLTYVKGNTHLVILLENEVVTSIEYLMA